MVDENVLCWEWWIVIHYVYWKWYEINKILKCEWYIYIYEYWLMWGYKWGWYICCDGIGTMVVNSIYYELEVGLLDINNVVFMKKCGYDVWLYRLALWPSSMRNVITSIGFITIDYEKCDYVDWLCDHQLWEMWCRVDLWPSQYVILVMLTG